MFDTHILLHYIKILSIVGCFSRKLTVFILWLIIIVFTGLYGYSVLRLKDWYKDVFEHIYMKLRNGNPILKLNWPLNDFYDNPH